MICDHQMAAALAALSGGSIMKTSLLPPYPLQDAFETDEAYELRHAAWLDHGLQCNTMWLSERNRATKALELAITEQRG